ncbi:MAG: putative signal transduction histidine kinase [Chitinophagaceae bacterium]|nr:putative signal transduction histidine kinase [Chitinophagaceae bacterium]
MAAHIINILFAFAGFLFYNSVSGKKSHLSHSSLKSIRLLTVSLIVIGNVIVCYFLFHDNIVLKSVELTSIFLLVYITLHYLKLRKENKLQVLYTENLRIAKDHAEVEALKLQLDPHFLFNTLNTLHHLIKPENEEARKYVQLLADVYRYILKNKTKELVLLRDELNFSQQYFYLLSIRYGQAIHFDVQIDLLKAEDYLVIPVSIQILIENGIKHNRFTVEEPLCLLINMEGEFITVQNKVRGINKSDSLKIGLKNLSERSLMIVNKPLVIKSSDLEFTVHLPLLKYK